MSFQTALENRTPFNAKKYVVPDPQGQETVVVVVVATFEGTKTPSLQLAEVQIPPHDADVYFGAPGLSSTRYEADIAIEKPFVDILVNGTGYAPKGRLTPAVPVFLEVADIRKELLVSGDRVWRPGPLGPSPSRPEPFASMSIIYERAFGGSAHDAAEPRNLVGVSFRGVRSRDPNIRTEVPNVEYPKSRIQSKGDKPEPAGFGVIGRAWMPRVRFAGTFDQEWKERQWPLLPEDFDPRFYQSAPADQQSRSVRGGEIVRVMNLTPDGIWQFRLPELKLRMLCLFDNRRLESHLRLDTVLIEPDDRRVTLTSRAALRIRRNHGLMREIVLGHVAEGWIRARMSGKRYIDYSGRAGILQTMPNYVL